MSDMTTVTIDGLDELIAKARDTGAMLSRPLKRFFTKAALSVQKHSRQLAPVDRGQLRASIAYDVDSGVIPEWAMIGPDSIYGASVEFGVGDFNEGPGGLGQAPLPTAEDLMGWAKRHGANAYVVARAIEKRGGNPPRPYMRDGFTDSLDDITRYLDEAGQEMEEAWRA
jgi:hypothetical protein